jgi:hypothetical protein
MQLIYTYMDANTDKKGEGKYKYGQPITLRNQFEQRMIPIYYGTIYDLYKDQPATLATFLTALAFFGMGTQTYEPKEKEKKNKFTEP